MKRVISFLLSILILTGAVCVTSYAWDVVIDDTFILGDANNDSAVNAKDSLCVRLFIAGNYSGSLVTDAADINADGTVSSRDSLIIKAALAQQISLCEYDTDEAIFSLSVAGNPLSDYCIVIPADTPEDSNVLYSSDQLRKYIKIATGVNLTVCRGNAVTPHAFYFHAVDEASELGRQLQLENYKYTVKNGEVDIYGTRRGNMYAVYEILENYLGYRFYNDNEIFIYKSRTVDIPEGTDVYVEPKLTFRFCAQSFSRDNALYYYFPRRLNGTQIGGYDEELSHGTLTGPHFINAHSFLYYYTMAHGNYIGEGEGQLYKCYTSGLDWIEEYNKKDTQNPITNLDWQPCATDGEVYRDLFTGMLRTMTMIQQWGHIFRTDLGASSMSFSINDNVNYCKCRSCNKIAVTQKEGHSGLFVAMANRAAEELQSYYPGMKVYMILYDHTVPATVRPSEWLIIMFCGSACNNHFIGSGGCGSDKTPLGSNNSYDEFALPKWGEFCRESGAEMWFWYYPVTYAYYLIGCPNILNIYYDYSYLINECNVTGIYYEGGGRDYNFENLKAYLSSKMMWEPEMSYERFTEIMKEYLYMYYGDGYEELYELILLENEAGDEAGCFINNHDRPWDMYSKDYIDAHYEQMRELLCTAYEKAGDEAQKKRVKTMLMCFDFLGLSSSYERMYTNGDTSSRELYVSRYDAMYDFIVSNKLVIYCNDIYLTPSEIDYSVNPMTQFYEMGSYRTGI